MEQKYFGYSMKNIPIAGKSAFLKRIIEKVESVIRRMRWKALISEKPQHGDLSEKYGFPSTKAPPPRRGPCSLRR